MALSLALVLHAHQPVGNFEHVFETTYRSSYLPFLDAVEPRPWFRFAMHFSGPLLEWIEARHPEYLARLRGLIAADRLELLGGGYFEPILAAIPDADKQAQILRLHQYLRRLNAQPRGLWLAERVWEPELPAALARAGVDYAIVDDTHLLLAGFEPEETFGYFLTEHGGQIVKVIPSNQFLRLAIPFRPEREAIDFLLAQAQRQPGALLTMADDLEKFGSWPHTFQHVFTEGWLARFLDALEGAAEKIETVTPAQYLSCHASRGLAYLPSASYEELMRWALPVPAAALFERAAADPAVEPYRRFLAGAPWRGFLAKYREANAMHKFALDVSRRLGAASIEPSRLAEAEVNLLAAQCNDAYWHGLFGGLYAPHLRDSVYACLLRADRLLEPAPGPPRRADLNGDGEDEIELRSRESRVVIAPAEGGVVEEWDFRPTDTNLINSLQRRPEAYHEQIRARIVVNPARLPGGRAAAAAELERLLQYDAYPRSCYRLYVFPADKTFADFLALRLEEDPAAAAGHRLVNAEVGSAMAAPMIWLEQRAAEKPFRKALGLSSTPAEALECRIEWPEGPPGKGYALGLEMVLNLLAPQAPGRILLADQRELPLGWQGELHAQVLELRDGWRRFHVRLMATPPPELWWVRPIETVSQSEAGFERVYQGSAILAVWRRPPAVLRFTAQVAARAAERGA